MTVDQVLTQLQNAFPRFDTKAASVWTALFVKVLGPHEGQTLAAAHSQVMITFNPRMRAVPYPVPSDYVAHLPEGFHEKMKTLGHKGSPIDFEARHKAEHAMLIEWEREQGYHLSNGVPEVMSALTWIASKRANLRKLDEPGSLRLRRRDVVLAYTRAISLQRRIDFGPPHRVSDASSWWAQCSDIMTRWGITVAWEEWSAFNDKDWGKEIA